MISAYDLKDLTKDSCNKLTKRRQRILKKIEKEMIAAAKNGLYSIDYNFDVKDYCFFRDYLNRLGYVVTNTTLWYAKYMGRNAIISWHSHENKDYDKLPTGKMPIKSLELCSKEAEEFVNKYWDKYARPKFRGN